MQVNHGEHRYGFYDATHLQDLQEALPGSHRRREARLARYCSKTCKAIEQEQRTGQFAELLSRRRQLDDLYDVDISDLDWGASDGD